MTDTASLRIKVDARDIDRGITRLKDLRAQASATERALRSLNGAGGAGGTGGAAGGSRATTAALRALNVEVRNLRTQAAASQAEIARLNARLNGLRGGARKASAATGALAEGFRTLRSAVVAYIGAQGVRYLAQVADEAVNVRNRLRAVTDSNAELNKTFDELAAVSTRSRVSMQTSANLYQRMKMGTDGLGLSQGELIRVTETINKSFKISGASADEASGSIRQLTQAFNANMLRGEELNSINEQAPILMKAIQKELGMSGKELRKFAETGGITAEIMIRAFERIRKEVDEKFGRTAKTIEDKLLDVRREFVIWADENENLNTTFDSLIKLLDLMGGGLRTLLDYSILPVVAGVTELGEAFGVTAAILATEGTEDTFYTKMQEEFPKLNGMVIAFYGTVDKATEEIKRAWGELGLEISRIWEEAIVEMRKMLGAFIDNAARLLDKIPGLDGLTEEVSGFAQFLIDSEVDLTNYTKGMAKLNSEYTTNMARIDEVTLGLIAETLAKADALQATSELGSETGKSTTADEIARKALEKKNAAVKNAIDLLTNQRKAITKGSDAIRKDEAARKSLKIVQRINRGLKKDSIELTKKEEAAIYNAVLALLEEEDASKKLEKQRKKLAASTKKAIKTEQRYQAALGRAAKAYAAGLDEKIGKLAELRREQELLIKASADGLLSPEKAGEQMDEILTDIDRVNNGLKTIEETAEEVGDVFSNVFTRIGDELGGLGEIFGIFGKSFGKDLASGLQGLSSAPGGIGSIAGNAGSVLGGLIGFGGSPASAGQALGKGGAMPMGVDTALGTSGFLSSISGMVPSMGPAVASAYVSAMFKDIEQEDWGQLLDKAMPGFFLGTISEKLGISFGGGPSDKTQTAALQLGTGAITQGGFNTPGGQKFSEQGRAAADTMTALLGDVAQQLAGKLGTELSGELEFIVGERDGIRVNFDGEELFKSNEITEVLDVATQHLFDMAGQTSDIYANLANDGESTAEAFLRLDGQLTIAQAVAKDLGLNLDLLGDAGITTADVLVQASGGLDQFVINSQAFYDSFTSNEDKFNNFTNSLNDSFDDIGVALPATRNDFANLVKSTLEAGEGSEELAADLMAISPAADVYYKSIEKGELLKVQLMKLEGDEVGALAAERKLLLSTLTEDQQVTQQAIHDKQDEIRKEKAATKAATDLRSLNIKLLKAQGRDEEALSMIRADALSEYDTAIQKAVDSGNDLEATLLRETKATRELLYEEEDLAAERVKEAAAIANMNKERNLQIRLLQIMGEDEKALALTREGILENYDIAIQKAVDSNDDVLEASLRAQKSIEETIFKEEDLATVRERNATRLSALAQQASLFMSLSGDPVTGGGTGGGLIDREALAAGMEALANGFRSVEDVIEDLIDLRPLQIRLLETEGKELEALALSREMEIEGVTEAEAALLNLIYAQEDLNTENEKAAILAEEEADRLANLNNLMGQFVYSGLTGLDAELAAVNATVEEGLVQANNLNATEAQLAQIRSWGAQSTKALLDAETARLQAIEDAKDKEERLAREADAKALSEMSRSAWIDLAKMSMSDLDIALFDLQQSYLGQLDVAKDLGAATEQLEVFERLYLAQREELIDAAQEVAESDAADALREISDEMKNLAQTAFGRLQDSVNAEKDRLKADYDREVESINNRYEGILEGLTSQLDSVNDRVGTLRTIAGELASAVDTVRPDLTQKARRAAQSRLTSVLDMVKSGADISQFDISGDIGTLTEPSEQLFGSFAEFALAQAKTRVVLGGLEEEATKQLTSAEQQVVLLEEQIEQAKSTQEWELEQRAVEFENEMTRLDTIIENAQEQLNALNNIESGILSLGAALEAFASSVQATAQAQIAAVGGASHMVSEEVAAASRGGRIIDNKFVPGFANGTDSTPAGDYIVGENGPEIMTIPRAGITPNDKIMDQNAVKEEIKRGNVQMIKYLKRMWETQDKWDVEGIPAERTT